MIYLEAPVGVGFSYSDNLAEYNCTDDTTALDNLRSVEKFFELFPEYKGNDFFITGDDKWRLGYPWFASSHLLFATLFRDQAKATVVSTSQHWPRLLSRQLSMVSLQIDDSMLKGFVVKIAECVWQSHSFLCRLFWMQEPTRVHH